MKYIEILLNLISCKLHLQTIIPLLLMISILIVLVIILLLWPVDFDVKIKNIWINFLAIVIYIVGLILFLRLLRLLRINNEYDLHIFLNMAKFIIALPLKYKIVVCLFIFFLGLLWLLIYVKVMKILSWKCWQLHFYASTAHCVGRPDHDKMPEFPAHSYFYKYHKYFNSYNAFVSEWTRLYSNRMVIFRICRRINKLIERFTTSKDTFIDTQKYMRYLNIFVTAVLVVIFIYDCVCHNWILHITIIYLWFFAIFKLWYRICALLRHVNVIDYLFFEQAYCYPEIIFINFKDSDELELSNYLYYPHRVDLVRHMSTYYWHVTGLLSHPMYVWKRYYKYKLGNVIIWVNLSRFSSPIWFKFDDLQIINGRYFVKHLYCNKKIIKSLPFTDVFNDPKC